MFVIIINNAFNSGYSIDLVNLDKIGKIIFIMSLIYVGSSIYTALNADPSNLPILNENSPAIMDTINKIQETEKPSQVKTSINLIQDSNLELIPLSLANYNKTKNLELIVNTINVTDYNYTAYYNPKRNMNETGMWERDNITTTIRNYSLNEVTISNPKVTIYLDVGLPYLILLGNTSIEDIQIHAQSNLSKSIIIEYGLDYILSYMPNPPDYIPNILRGRWIMKLTGTIPQSHTEIELTFDLPSWDIISWWIG